MGSKTWLYSVGLRGSTWSTSWSKYLESLQQLNACISVLSIGKRFCKVINVHSMGEQLGKLDIFHLISTRSISKTNGEFAHKNGFEAGSLWAVANLRE